MELDCFIHGLFDLTALFVKEGKSFRKARRTKRKESIILVLGHSFLILSPYGINGAQFLPYQIKIFICAQIIKNNDAKLSKTKYCREESLTSLPSSPLHNLMAHNPTTPQPQVYYVESCRQMPHIQPQNPIRTPPVINNPPRRRSASESASLRSGRRRSGRSARLWGRLQKKRLLLSIIVIWQTIVSA
jgi:hypothetical protein